MSAHLLARVEAAGAAGHLLPSTVANLREWLAAGFLPAWAEASLAELLDAGAWGELDDRFFKVIAFGTGGMRGRTVAQRGTAAEVGGGDAVSGPAHPAVGSALLNDFTVVRATLGLYRYTQRWLEQRGERFGAPKLVIAHDVRFFSRHFCELAASTWARLGGRAMVFDGPRSTPHLSFAVRHVSAHAGIVITASHNPPHDNGYKVYFGDGAQVVFPHAEGIIGEVRKVDWGEVAPFLAKELDPVVTLPLALDEAYLEALEENVLDPAVFEAGRPKVVFSPLHGTGGVMSIPVLERYEVDVHPVAEQMRMDSRFPTVKSPNPENAEAFALGLERAKAIAADVVVATDPDCDRMGVAARADDGTYVRFTGNQTGAMLAAYRLERLKELGWLPAGGTPRAALIKTFVTTPLQAAIAERHGLKVINCLTGFKWIGEKLGLYEAELAAGLLRAEGLALHYDRTTPAARRRLLLQHSTYYVFGGEESYGYLASDRVRDKDGNAAVLMVCELAAWLKARGLSFPAYLDQLYAEYGYYLEDLLNLYFEGAAGAQTIARLVASYRAAPPRRIGDYHVVKFTDFGTQDLQDADGKAVPKEDFYFAELDNGYSFAVRGSGTEPKAKIYLFAREDVPTPADLAEVKERTAATLRALARLIEADARARAQG